MFNYSQRQELNLEPSPFRIGCFQLVAIEHELMHTLGFYHMHTEPDRDTYVRINWQNIQPGNVSVCIHNIYNKFAPVPCAHGTHKDITFTPHHCHYYVQQQWLLITVLVL